MDLCNWSGFSEGVSGDVVCYPEMGEPPYVSGPDEEAR